MTNRLQWDVLVSTQIPVLTSDLPPGASQMKWSPISSTLISGKRDAVLVDTAITVDQNKTLVDWIAYSGKNLTAIYATHGHGDHFFGANTIQKRFPKARFVATSEVIAVMRKQASVPVVESYWKPRFPGQIDSTLLIADELKDGVLELEGKQLISIPLGHTDTDSTTCLHVPSIGLAVCGDALYNDVHLHLGESNAEVRNEWIAALDRNRVAEGRGPLLPDTRGPAHPIRQITSRRHENISAISTGLLPIPRPRLSCTNRCLPFIPSESIPQSYGIRQLPLSR